MVSVVNIQGVYLSANMEDDVFMIFYGIMAELLLADNYTLYRN